MRIRDAIPLYLAALEAKGYAPRTRATYEPHLVALTDWLEERGIDFCPDVDVATLHTFHQELVSGTSRYGRPFSLSLQAGRLGVVRRFFAFLVRRGLLLVNPARELELPRHERRMLPYGLPTPQEMERMIAAPDTDTGAGLRDRAVLEVLYSSAIRNAELRALRVWDVDLVDGTLTVFRGKRRKDRTIPLGREACRWLGEYLTRVRPHWVRSKSDPLLFLTAGGRPLDFSNLNKLVKACARAAGVTKHVTVHTYRHACASHMLQAGAEIRHLQRILGHKSLLSTAIYTHLDLADLKRIHRRCHPRGRVRERRRVARDERDR
jgi:integrase/recombinase XerD